MTGGRLKILAFIILAVMTAALAAGCGEPTSTSTPDEPEYAGAITESLLQALINDEEFETFRGHFAPATQQTITEASFQQTHDQFFSAYGEYMSKEFTGTRENVQDVYTEVTYKAVFGNRPDGITIKVLFLEANNKAYTAGIFFQESQG